jgi:hypothetical protein
MDKHVVRGFWDYNIRAQTITIFLNVLVSVVLWLVQYFHLIPENSLGSKILGLVLFISYATLFIVIVLVVFRRQSKKNLRKLESQIEEIKSGNQ